MKLTVIALAAATALACVPSAFANSVNMKQITCEDAMNMSSSEQDILLAWLSGFYQGRDGDTIVDFDELENAADFIQRKCSKGKNRYKSVMGIINKKIDY